jgi:hypothetical protein
MKNILRTCVGLVAGMVVALVLLVLVELLSAVVHPVPPDFGETMEEMCLHVARYPHWVLAVVVPAWGLTAFTGTWTAGRIGNRAAALSAGVLLLAGLVLNISMLPYPLWFKTATLLVIPAALFTGGRLAFGPITSAISRAEE